MITLNSPWFELVQSGHKIYEGRRRTPKMADITPGQELNIFHHTNPDLHPFKVKVIEKLEFATFEEALKTLPIEQVLPLPDITVAQGMEIYKKYVSLATQERDGVVMIKIHTINT